MANFKSLQMTPPKYPVSGPGIGGRSIKVERGEFTLTAALAVNDTVTMFRLHPRFRVTSGFIKQTGLGASTQLQLGDAGDDDRYFTAASSASAGTRVDIAETGRDYLTTAYTDVILKVTGATTGATGTVVAQLHGYIEEPA